MAGDRLVRAVLFRGVLNTRYAVTFHIRNRRQAAHPIRAGILWLASLCLLGTAVSPSAAAVVRGTVYRLFAPAYYALTAGNYLFLNYPWLVDGGPSIEWTETLLERLDGAFHVVANMHHWDGLRARAPVLLDLLKQHGGKGVFWGHYHTTQVLTVEGIPTFGINAGRSHIRDLGRPSFSLIRAEPLAPYPVVVALDAVTGQRLWEFNLGTKVTSGLAISGNTLFVTGRNGALYAFISRENQ